MASQPDIIVQKALSFIEKNFAEPFSVKMVADEVGYSQDWIKALFKKVTGEGIWTHLHRLRIEKSKELLRQTNLPISEIALQVGFNSHVLFAATFRKKTGTTPSAFRSAIRNAGESSADFVTAEERKGQRSFFVDRFDGPQIGPWWEIVSGEWLQESDYISGKSEEEAYLRLTQLLPENYRISFHTRLGAGKNTEPSDLNVVLQDGEDKKEYCKFMLGGFGNSVGRVYHKGQRLLWNGQAILKKSQWQRIVVELKDDTVRLWVDDQQMFLLRDAFPPPYADRCKFMVGCWRNTIHLRDVEIRDLGSSSLVPAIRQGDVLFNSGAFERAQDFYQRHLQFPGSGTNLMELRYKIGMTCLRRGQYSQAASWLSKIITPAEGDFWSQEAQIGLLEVSAHTDSSNAFLAKLEACFNHPCLQDGARQLANVTRDDLSSRGFVEEALRISQMLSVKEKKATIPYSMSLYSLALSFLAANRYQECSAALINIVQSPIAAEAEVLRALHQLANSYLWLLENEKSMEALDRISSRTNNQTLLAHCDIYRGFNLRASRKLREAERLFADVPDRFPKAEKGMLAFSQLHRAHILCMMGMIEEAERIMAQSQQTYPGKQDRENSHFSLTGLLRGEYDRTAEELLAGLESDGSESLEPCARQRLVVGILFGLIGNSAKAKATWSDVVLRFPAERYAFYSVVAQALTSGETSGIEEIVYPDQMRSEIFYFLGLLFQSRKEKDRAMEFFRLSSALDPTLRWPAYFAGDQLERL